MTKIGVQAMMLKTQFAEDGAFATLKRLSEVGFHAVELSQISMAKDDVAEIDRARSEFGMEIAALSATLETPEGMPGDSLANDFDKIVEDCRLLDTTIVRIGMMPFWAMASHQALLEFCTKCEEMAARLAELEIRLCYHNHHVEFARYGGQYILDIIRAKAPSMRFELDVHWIHRGGKDPVLILQDYAELVDLVHLKDYRIGPLGEDAFAALKAGDVQGFMTAFTGVVQFAEVGEGNLDFTAIIDQSLTGGAKYLLIEQDDQYGRDPFDCLITSRDNLIALGYEHLL